MCGIAGFYGFKDDKLLRKFSRQLAHRGPDGEGFYQDSDVSLLNRRLAIIDLKGGDQPIYNEDKSVVVVYNGEIYNYRELKAELLKKGHVFKTESDTEVIVHGYEEWGEKCFDRLNGMFAIALRDTRKNKMLLVRDHFGIKPLYYSIFNDKLVFSSEIKPIHLSGLIKTSPNNRIIYRYLKFRVHDNEKETFFKNIYRLMPGELLEISKGKIEIRRFSNLEDDLLSLEKQSTDAKKFKDELIKAIKYRLISDVPVGTCLSGGLDSSTVVAVVNRLLSRHAKEARSVGKRQKTFSAVFPNSSNDEEKYIDAITSKIANITSYKVKPNSADFFKEIKDFVRTQEEPTISTGPYAQYKVMEMAKGKVKVLLDGQGSDEMMAGYLPYYLVYFRELLENKKYFRLLSEVMSAPDVVIRYIKEKLSASLNVSGLLNRDFYEKHQRENFIVENKNLKKRLIQDVFYNSLPSLLRYEDKNAMRFSIEGRVPFLDFNLIRRIFSMPDEAIIKGGWNKYILREATKDLLPTVINQRRNKIGFTTPEYEWFMDKKEVLMKIFTSLEFGHNRYFNQVKIVEAFQDFLEKKNTDTMVFWRILNLHLWHKEFFDVIAKQNKKPYQFGQPNRGKKLAIKVGGKTYFRYPLKTEAFKKGDDYVSKIRKAVEPYRGRALFFAVSEKIVAISQGRSYFIWDIKPTLAAKVLSSFVKRTPYGIGLGSPWTMQLAIDEVGLPKILLATFVSALTKIFGIGGMFYRVTGSTVRSIDGPTSYSLYPSNVSAKLGPKDPNEVADKIERAAIVDANDLGQNVLGNSTGLPDKLVEKIIKDNPMGQADEQTPVIIVTKNRI